MTCTGINLPNFHLCASYNLEVIGIVLLKRPFCELFFAQSLKKHLLISSCPSSRLSAYVSAVLVIRLWRNFMTLGTPMMICRETQNLVKIVREYRALHAKTYVSLIVDGDLIRHKGVVVQYSIFLYY
jgi:hypothetical protein